MKSCTKCLLLLMHNVIVFTRSCEKKGFKSPRAAWWSNEMLKILVRFGILSL